MILIVDSIYLDNDLHDDGHEHDHDDNKMFDDGRGNASLAYRCTST